MTKNATKFGQDREVFSRPIMQIEYPLHTQQSQYIASRCVEFVDRCLYYYGGHFLNRGMKEGELEKVQEALLAKFDEFTQEADSEIDRLKQLLRSQGIVKLPAVSYTKPEKVRIGVSNPYTRRFLKLMTKLDEVCRVIDCAWMTETITAAQRSDALFVYRNKLRAMAAQLRQERNAIDKRLSKEFLQKDEKRRRVAASGESVKNRKKADPAKAGKAKSAAKARMAKDEGRPKQSDPGVVRNADLKPKKAAAKKEEAPKKTPEPAAATA